MHSKHSIISFLLFEKTIYTLNNELSSAISIESIVRIMMSQGGLFSFFLKRILCVWICLRVGIEYEVVFGGWAVDIVPIVASEVFLAASNWTEMRLFHYWIITKAIENHIVANFEWNTSNWMENPITSTLWSHFVWNRNWGFVSLKNRSVVSETHTRPRLCLPSHERI